MPSHSFGDPKIISFSSAGFSGFSLLFFFVEGVNTGTGLFATVYFTYMTSHTDTMTDQSGGAERLLGDVEAGINFS